MVKKQTSNLNVGGDQNVIGKAFDKGNKQEKNAQKLLDDQNNLGSTIVEVRQQTNNAKAGIDSLGSNPSTDEVRIAVNQNVALDDVFGNLKRAEGISINMENKTDFENASESVIDSTRKPQMFISTVTNGLINGGNTSKRVIRLKFTSDEVTNDFDVSKITVSPNTASLSNFTTDISNKLFFVDLSLDVVSTIFTIFVDDNKFTSNGIGNARSNDFKMRRIVDDDVRPTITITGNNNSIDNKDVTLTFNIVESNPHYFKESSLTVVNGNIINFVKINDNQFTALVSPTQDGICSVEVKESAFEDEAGNKNTGSNKIEWTHDLTKPEVEILTSDIVNGSVNNKQSIGLTFNITETHNHGFDENKIILENCTLESFTKVDKNQFTANAVPKDNGLCSCHVTDNVFVDAAGNNNKASNKIEWTYDSTKPEVSITASNILNNSVNNEQSIGLTFNITEDHDHGFEQSKISLVNCTLESFKKINKNQFTANAVPTADGLCSVKVNAGVFADEAGNNNNASNIIGWTHDLTKPEVEIGTADIVNGSVNNKQSIDLTFNITETHNHGFDESKISLVNCTLNTFNQVNANKFTANLVPTTDGLCSLKVNADEFSDEAGNSNKASNVLEWTYDFTNPTVLIESSQPIEARNNKASHDLTFTITETNEHNFGKDSITVSNGIIGTLTKINKNKFNCTVYPEPNKQCSVSVNAGTFLDEAGNSNIVSNTLEWFYDNVKPSITVSSDNLNIHSKTNQQTIEVKFVLDELSSDFGLDKVTVNNGQLSNLTGSNLEFKADFTANSAGTCSVVVKGDEFIDVAENGNLESNQLEWSFENTKPSVAVSSTTTVAGSNNSFELLEINFDLTEEPESFTKEHITLTNLEFRGDIVNVSSTKYLVNVVPVSKGKCEVKVDADKFKDLAGNNNVASNIFSWTHNDDRPAIAIFSDNVINGQKSNVSEYSLKFISSEKLNNFTEDKLTLTNGTIKDFVKDTELLYKATFIPTVEGECKIELLEGAVKDEDNKNNIASSLTFTYDITQPTMNISSDDVSHDGHFNKSVTLKFEANEITNSFTQNDITVVNGTLSDFAGKDKSYTVKFTPENEGTCTVNVVANSFKDEAGNDNIKSNIFEWTHDVTKPNLVISSTTDLGVLKLNNKNLVNLVFKLNEISNDFEKEDISVVNGTINNFLRDTDDLTKYTADFTPTNDGDCEVKVLADKFKDLAGNSNDISNIFGWEYDSTAPTILISSVEDVENQVKNNNTISLKFSISDENLPVFKQEHITLVNGTLSEFSTSDNYLYTAKFTPESDGECKIKVDADKFKDVADNNNIVSNEFKWTYDGTKPTVTITADVDKDSKSNKQSINLTFELSEKSNDFTVEDITINNGTLSDFVITEVGGKKYTATFTPTIDGVCDVKVLGGKFNDLAGNSNELSDTYQWTYDNTKPVVTVSLHGKNGNDIVSGSNTNDDTVKVIINLSEETKTNLDLSMITVKENGLDLALDDQNTEKFTKVGNEYHFHLKNLVDTKSYIVYVAENILDDLAGNKNEKSNVFGWSYDGTKPGITISNSSDITNNSFSIKKSTTLTFEVTEETTDFEIGDITVVNGNLSEFLKDETNPLLYTVKVTAIEEGECSVKVDADKFKDASNNLNTESDVFKWTYDITVPAVTITAQYLDGEEFPDRGQTTDWAIKLIFTMSEELEEGSFTKEDITTSANTEIKQFYQHDTNKKIYYAIATAKDNSYCSVQIKSGKIKDKAGIFNRPDSYKFEWTKYQNAGNTPPTLTMESSDVVNSGSIEKDKIKLKITLSEDVLSNKVEPFNVSLLNLTNCTASNFTDLNKFDPTSAPNVFEVTLTSELEGICKVKVLQGNIQDKNGLKSNQDFEFVWRYDKVTGAPEVTITANPIITNNITNNRNIINLVFELTEESPNFGVGSITATNGTISNFVKDPAVLTRYTADFNTTGNGSCVVKVEKDKFKDKSGLSNENVSKLEWIYDDISPIITVSCRKNNGTDVDTGSVINNNEFAFYFNLSEVPNRDLELTDLTVLEDNVKQTLDDTNSSDFTKVDDKNYSVKLKNPIDGSLYKVYIDENLFTDSAGNSNIKSNEFELRYDVTPPTVGITFTDLDKNAVGDANGAIVQNASGILIFNFSEEINNFNDGMISITDSNGQNVNNLLNDLEDGMQKVSGTQYTRSVAGAPVDTTYTINVPVNVFSDVAGNLNAEGVSFSLTVDGTAPTVTLTAYKVIDPTGTFPYEDDNITVLQTNNTTNDQELVFTIVLSEIPNRDLELGDITVLEDDTQQVLNTENSSDFTKIDNLTYVVRFFNPKNMSIYKISVSAGTFTDAAGNQNAGSNEFVWTYNNDITPPTVGITFTDGMNQVIGDENGAIVQFAIGTLKFNFSEEINNFTDGMITITDGNGQNVNNLLVDQEGGMQKVSGTQYTRSVFLAGGLDTTYTINVPVNVFSDVAGNFNTEGVSFSLTVDGTAPTVTLTVYKVNDKTLANPYQDINLTLLPTGQITNDEELLVKIALSEKPKIDLELSNLSVLENGTKQVLNNTNSKEFKKVDDRNYSVVLMDPEDGAVYNISVNAGEFEDAAGNQNAGSEVFVWQKQAPNPAPRVDITVRNGGFDGNSGNDVNQTVVNGILTFAKPAADPGTEADATNTLNMTDIIFTFSEPINDDFLNNIVIHKYNTGTQEWDLVTNGSGNPGDLMHPTDFNFGAQHLGDNVYKTTILDTANAGGQVRYSLPIGSYTDADGKENELESLFIVSGHRV